MKVVYPVLYWICWLEWQSIILAGRNESDLSWPMLNMLIRMTEYYPSRLEWKWFILTHVKYVDKNGRYYPSR